MDVISAETFLQSGEKRGGVLRMESVHSEMSMKFVKK